jgi:hypothetical protein
VGTVQTALGTVNRRQLLLAAPLAMFGAAPSDRLGSRTASIIPMPSRPPRHQLMTAPLQGFSRCRSSAGRQS